ncbi:MAG TPA: hypothetical protein VFA45_24505 [Actinomycetes bacterium]|jgi:hypothetical protein|nr:hypothetical protein [Actinomycetes bacterium]
MTELFKAITNNPLRFLYAWLLPSAIAVSAFALIIFPAIDTWPIIEDIPRGKGSGGLVLAFASFAIAMILALNSLSLYRFLEGYMCWPAWLYDSFRKKQVNRWMRLRRQVMAADAERDATQMALLEEKLKRYPSHEKYIVPTRLGNALRALETYGYARYNLDSQALWYELEAVAPESLQKQTEDGRVGIDFFVSSIYLSAFFSILAIIVGIIQWNGTVLVAGILAPLLIPLLYQRAVVSTTEWQAAVQALINVGRVKLASELGLTMPPTLDEERKMWGAVADLVLYGDADADDEALGKALDKYRLRIDEDALKPRQEGDD